MAAYPTTLLAREDVARGTVAFHVAKPPGFRFNPGQAIDVILPGAREELDLRHTFSIVSAPHEPRIEFATRMRDSEYKRALGSLQAGSPLAIEGPFGSLTLPADRSRPVVLIAGGIGITPCISMLRHATHEAASRAIMLFYSNRRIEDSAFLVELQGLERALASFRLVATMTDADASAWKGPRGKIDAELLRSQTQAVQAPVYLVTGPPAMVEAMRTVLASLGVAEESVSTEQFYGY